MPPGGMVGIPAVHGREDVKETTPDRPEEFTAKAARSGRAGSVVETGLKPDRCEHGFKPLVFSRPTAAHDLAGAPRDLAVRVETTVAEQQSGAGSLGPQHPGDDPPGRG